MRYYTFLDKKEFNTGPAKNCVSETYMTWSEDEILFYFKPIWSQKIIQKYGEEYFKKIDSSEKCVIDFINFMRAKQSEACGTIVPHLVENGYLPKDSIAL